MNNNHVENFNQINNINNANQIGDFNQAENFNQADYLSEINNFNQINNVDKFNHFTQTDSKQRRLIKFIDISMLENNFTFCESHYVTALIKETFDEKAKNCCLNINCSLSINERAYINKIFSNVEVKQLVTSLLIRNIRNIIYNFNKYIVIDIFINNYIKKNNKQISTINKFSIEIYIVDNFKANLLLNNNVFKVQRVAININTQIATLINCNTLIISINITIKKNADQKRTIKIKIDFKISTKVIVKILIFFHNNLFDDRNFFFESQCQQSFNHKNSVFAHIVNAIINYVIIRNINQLSITLRKRFQFDTLIKYN